MSAPADNASPVREGEVIGGKYQVERILGIGGMGVVVAARHLQLDQRVALKFLRPEARDNQEVVERFTREARAAAKIQSEHVGRVLDVGQLDSGDLYMVMEYLEGRDLGDVLQKDGPLPIARAIDYVLEACEAIAEAHAHGIVHRDLKPANLFLAERIDGSKIVKVLDFGISKLTLGSTNRPDQATDPSLTNPTAVMGSPLYMSPEQMHASMRVDARSDVWALGVILYEMVCGKTPFEEESIPLIHAAILHNDPPPLADRIPNASWGKFGREVFPKFEAVVRRCLEKDPARRFQDVAELVEALAPLSPKQGRATAEKVKRLRSAARSERAAPPVVMPDPNAPSSTITAWGEGRGTSFGTKRLVAIGLVFGLAGAAGVLLVRRPWEITSAPVEPSATRAELLSAPPPEQPAQRPSGEPTVAAAPTASASAKPTPEDTARAEEASRLFKAANVRFDARDWRGAALLYEQADATFPGAKPKLRAAICWDKLGKTDLAAAWYEKFLADDPDPERFSAQEIEGARRRLDAIRRGAGIARGRPRATHDAAAAEPSSKHAATSEPASTAAASTTAAPVATTSPAAPADPTSAFGDRE